MNKLVKTFVNSNAEMLDEEVNEFNKTHNVFATQFRHCLAGNSNGTEERFSAMLFYKEE